MDATAMLVPGLLAVPRVAEVLGETSETRKWLISDRVSAVCEAARPSRLRNGLPLGIYDSERERLSVVVITVETDSGAFYDSGEPKLDEAACSLKADSSMTEAFNSDVDLAVEDLGDEDRVRHETSTVDMGLAAN